MLDSFHAAFPAISQEPPLAPRLPFVDPHHHLFAEPDHPYFRQPPSEAHKLYIGRVATAGFSGGYLPEDFVRESQGFHRVTSVYVEAESFYDKSAPHHLRPVGETQAVSAMGAKWGLCRGIVALVDFNLSLAEVKEVIAAHAQAVSTSECSLVGVRLRNNTLSPNWAKKLLRSKETADICRWLGSMGLVVDVLVDHFELTHFAALAANTPDTRFVLNHAGMPFRAGLRGEELDQVWEAWRKGMRTVAGFPNVMLKFGGFGLGLFGFQKGEPYSSIQAAAMMKPWFDETRLLFHGRMMFESNFPMDKGLASYGNIWNAFMRLCKDVPLAERADLFFECANRTYNLKLDKRQASEFFIPDLETKSAL